MGLMSERDICMATVERSVWHDWLLGVND